MVATVDDLSGVGGQTLVGVHQFTTVNILGGASVDFGGDRIMISDLSQSQIDVASSLYIDKLNAEVLALATRSSGLIEISDSSGINNLDLTGTGPGTLSINGDLTLNDLTITTPISVVVNGTVNVSGPIQVSNGGGLTAENMTTTVLTVQDQGSVEVSHVISVSGDVVVSVGSEISAYALSATNFFASNANVSIDRLDIAQDMSVEEATILTLPDALSGEVPHELYIVVGGTVWVDESSRIDITGKGYNGMVGFNLGSYGGQNNGQPTDSVYGHYVKATHAGSHRNVPGGGYLNLSAATLTLDGEIVANGEGGASLYAGSGGGVHIDVDTLSLGVNAGIQANGGDGLYRIAGGGGRISIYAGNLASLDSQLLSSYLYASGGSLGPVSGAGTIYLKEKGVLDAHAEKHLIVKSSRTTLESSTPILRVGQHVIVNVLPESDEWVIQVADMPWTPSSAGLPFGVNGGLAGLYVDLDANDNDESTLYQIASNTEDSIVIQTADDLSGYNGSTLVGIHRFNTISVSGGASVDFGGDRVLIENTGGVDIDFDSTLYADEIIQ